MLLRERRDGLNIHYKFIILNNLQHQIYKPNYATAGYV